MDGLVDQHDRCRFSSTCTNEGPFISDLPPRKFWVIQYKRESKQCTAPTVVDVPMMRTTVLVLVVNEMFVISIQHAASGGVNNLNQCVNGTVCTNSGRKHERKSNRGLVLLRGAPGTTKLALPGQPPIFRP